MTYRITPGNLIYHTLIGLEAAVVENTNPDMVGISGVVVDETRNTLVVNSQLAHLFCYERSSERLFPGPGRDGRDCGGDDPSHSLSHDKVIPKSQTTFIFSLPDGIRVRVDGRLLVARPEDRIAKRHRNRNN
ncbi:MAG: ribonuclease P protein component 1 [Methanosarcinales archaeon]|nr:ribonuclease P protein component 1 [Methanosarcinales archaeon]